MSILLAIEGLPSSGKTTLVNILSSMHNWNIVPEPITDFTTLYTPDKTVINPLNVFYHSMQDSKCDHVT